MGTVDSNREAQRARCQERGTQRDRSLREGVFKEVSLLGHGGAGGSWGGK